MTDPAHVVFAVDSATYGGAEEVVLQLVRGLPRHVARTVAATDPVPWQLVTRARAAGAAVVRLPPVRGRSGPTGPVASALAGLRADVVHVNLTDPATSLRLLAGAVGSGSSVVADVHMTGTLGAPGERHRLAAAYRATDAVVARCRAGAEAVVGGLGVPARRVRVVRNGVPVRPAVGGAGDGGRNGPVRIRAVGRLTRQKGFDVLVAASRELVRHGLAVDVAVAGEGREHAALLTASAGLPVRFVGFVRDVRGFLAEADVFCLPSRAEALPLALLEALVAGLPCVATDVGDVAAAAGDLAAVVPPGDVRGLTGALTDLVGDPALRRRLGAAARRVAPVRFDERASVWAVLEVYRSALARSR